MKNYSEVELKKLGTNPPQSSIGVDGDGIIVSGGTTVIGGLYTATSDSAAATDLSQTSIIGAGQGGLSVPANGFSVGDSFAINSLGHLTCSNGDELTLALQFNGVDKLVIGPLVMPNIGDLHWEMDAFFVIRSLGTTGSVMGSFRFTFEENASDKFSGTAITQISALDTTVLNTLDFVANWDTAAGVNIHSEIFNLRKIY